MQTEVEEVQSVIYMLCFIGLKVKYASLMFGDDRGMIKSSTIYDGLFKNKHVAITYNRTR